MLRILALTLVAIALLGWNAARFIDAKPVIRTKDLDFLPSGDAARIMALGHDNTAAKLRWIDSFAYFQKQIDQRDDRITGTNDSTFVRLYDMLISLDPHFPDFYGAASMNLGCVNGRRMESIAFLQRGTLELPRNYQMWQMVAAELKVMYGYDKRQVLAFDGLLNAWHDAVEDPRMKQMVWDWKKQNSRRLIKGLEQIPYWLERLKTAAPNSPTRTFILGTMREQIARYALGELSHLAEEFKIQRGFAPVMPQDLLRPEILAKVWPVKRPPGLPIADGPDGPTLLPDPYGWPYLVINGKPVSPGLDIANWMPRVQMANRVMENLATKENAWPRTLEEAKAKNAMLTSIPHGGHWELNGTVLQAVWPTPPFPAYTPEP